MISSRSAAGYDALTRDGAKAPQRTVPFAAGPIRASAGAPRARGNHAMQQLLGGEARLGRGGTGPLPAGRQAVVAGDLAAVARAPHEAAPVRGDQSESATPSAIEVARSSARVPLPHRTSVEARLGRDLGGITAHTGAAAEKSCDALGAEAFAFDNMTVFAKANPDEATVVHEVTHVLQHRGHQLEGSSSIPARVPRMRSNDAGERVAESMAANPAALRGFGAGARSGAPAQLALKPRKGGLAAAGLRIPLLPALGAPVAIADLAPGTQLRIVRVIGADLAYEVVVVGTGQSGFLPAYAIQEQLEPMGPPTRDEQRARSNGMAGDEAHESSVDGKAGPADAEHGAGAESPWGADVSREDVAARGAPAR